MLGAVLDLNTKLGVAAKGGGAKKGDVGGLGSFKTLNCRVRD